MKEKETSQKPLVIIEWPNLYLWVFFAAILVGRISTGQIYSLARTVYYISGIIWSYEEIAHGDSWVRQLLGAIVMIFLFMSLFKLI